MAKNDDLKNCYKILGLKPGASLSEIKQAYRKLVKIEHPDLFNHNPLMRQQAEERFRRISEAYKKLRTLYQTDSINQSFNTSNTSTTSQATHRNSNASKNQTGAKYTSRTSTQARNVTTNTSRRTSHSTDRRTLPVLASLSLASSLILIGAILVVNNYKFQQKIASQDPANPQPNSNSENPDDSQFDFELPPLPLLLPFPLLNPSLQDNLASQSQCRTIAPTIGDSARIFARPSRNADTGKRIPQDTKVAFLGGMREFVEIQLPDKSRGWIFNDQLYPCAIASDSKPGIASVTAQPQQCLQITPTVPIGARIFSQPSRNADLGKRISRGVEATLLGERQEFVEIRLADGTQGWVFNDQIQAQPCSTPSDASVMASNTERSPQCRIVAPTIGDSARIFARPSRNADTGKRISQDTKVAFLGGMREFVEIQLPDKTKGWVFNDQLYPCAIASDSKPEIARITASQKRCLTIVPTAGGGARIFSRPSRNATVGKQIPKDTKVNLLGERREFVEIQLSDGYRGWIFNDQAQPCQSKVNSQKPKVKILNILPLPF